MHCSAARPDHVTRIESCFDALAQIYHRPRKQETDFQAVYTHQLFDDEKIRGYRGLRVEVYFAAGDLFTYFHVSYDQKHDTKFDDIEALLSSKMAPGSITKNLKTFKDVRRLFILRRGSFYTYVCLTLAPPLNAALEKATRIPPHWRTRVDLFAARPHTRRLNGRDNTL